MFFMVKAVKEDPFNANVFYDRMKDYVALTGIDFNDFEKGKKDLGALLFDDEGKIAGASQEAIQKMYIPLVESTGDESFEYTREHYSGIAGNLTEGQLVSLIMQIPTEKGVSGGDDSVIRAVDNYNKAEEESKADPQKYVADDLKQVHERFRGIVATYGPRAIIETSLGEKQAKIRDKFAIEDGGFDSEGAANFIKAYMNHYSGLEATEAQDNARTIGLNVARAAYSVIAAGKEKVEQDKRLQEVVTASREKAKPKAKRKSGKKDKK